MMTASPSRAKDPSASRSLAIAAPSGGTAALFPLPLAPFERYLLADDCPRYPMQFFCRLRFSGRFERAALEQAYGLSVGRHPLLRAVVRESSLNRVEWIGAREDQMPMLHWAKGDTGDCLPSAPYTDIRKVS